MNKPLVIWLFLGSFPHLAKGEGCHQNADRPPSLALIARAVVSRGRVRVRSSSLSRQSRIRLPEAHTNRLIHSASPYLLQHAHNPVDWYPWGEEAIAKARKENKLIFLSIGYSTCYWCHVAERTIYSNPAIAALMNQWFVNIKVDREERPDLDQTFMLARQVLTELRRMAKQSVSDAGPQALFCRKLLSRRKIRGTRMAFQPFSS